MIGNSREHFLPLIYEIIALIWHVHELGNMELHSHSDFGNQLHLDIILLGNIVDFLASNKRVAAESRGTMAVIALVFFYDRVLNQLLYRKSTYFCVCFKRNMVSALLARYRLSILIDTLPMVVQTKFSYMTRLLRSMAWTIS